MVKPFRIISLCPSTTFHLFDLGLSDSIVGRTKFCVEPKDRVASIPKVGGTKSPNFEKIRSLKPSHIMFNKEENDISHLKEIQSIAETIITTPVDIESSLEQNKLFGQIFNSSNRALEIEQEIRSVRHQLKSKSLQSFTYLYFIWNDPYMVAGMGTYIDEMLKLVGGENTIYELSEERYPSINKAQIKRLDVDLVLLSSEPFPFKEKHLESYQFAGKAVKLIDGQALSWHGSYTRIGLTYLIANFT